MPTRAAIFLDFDNVFSTLWELDRDAAIEFASEPADWLETLGNTFLNGAPRRWLAVRCYLNPAGYVLTRGNPTERYYYSRFRPGFVRAGFEVIDCPVLARGGKNAADIRIVIDALDLLNHRTHFDEFVLASGDSDFTPLLQRLRAEDRLVTVLSPGYHSSAYAALADRLLGFEELDALVRGAPEDEPEPEPEPASAATDEANIDRGDIGSAEVAFSTLIRQRFSEADFALNLASLAHEVDRTCPVARASNWFGKSSFSGAVRALNLPNARFSSHHVWEDGRHQSPESVGAVNGLPGAISVLVRALELPRIERGDWPKLFAALANYAAAHEFNLTEATKWTRDALAQEGVQISRTSINYVVRGVHFGGIQLDATAKPSAEQVGDAFLTALLDRAASLGGPLGAEAELSLREWLGIAGTELLQR